MSDEDLRYDAVRQKSVHNCFQRHEGILDQFLYWRVRSFEVDIHATKPYERELHGDWYVFHERWDASTSVETLSGFLRLLRGLHATVPEHEVVTVFLDLKDALDATDHSSHAPAALDALLREHLGSAIFTPAELLDGAARLQDAVAGGWPLLRELRGRFLFVLTGREAYLDGYAADDAAARSRVAFVSRRVERKSEIPGPSHVLFYNMSCGHVGLAAEVRAQGLVSRAYYVDTREAWRDARAAHCHHIATDKVNSAEDPWSRTAGAHGWPFEKLKGETPEHCETGEVCGVWSRTGDVWRERDSLYFHYRECSPEHVDAVYDFLVASPNSEVDDWAKASVMARASLGQDAPYFAMLRLGEKAGIRAQFRDRRGAPTVKRELRTPLGYEADTLALVRLEITRGGHQADGYASVDGASWLHVARWGFVEPLVYQGVGVSGHDARGGAKFLFAVPGGAARPRLDRGRIIGPSSGRRGWSDWQGTRRWTVDGWDG